MTHAAYREKLGLYALGALDAGVELAELETHLRRCTACIEELAQLERAAAELSRAARPVEPSPEVTCRILEVPEAEERPAALRLAVAPTTRGWRRGHGRREWSGRRMLRIAAGAAFVVVLGTLVVSQIELRRRLDRASSMIATGGDVLEFMGRPVWRREASRRPGRVQRPALRRAASPARLPAPLSRAQGFNLRVR